MGEKRIYDGNEHEQENGDWYPIEPISFFTSVCQKMNLILSQDLHFIISPGYFQVSHCISLLSHYLCIYNNYVGCFFL